MLGSIMILLPHFLQVAAAFFPWGILSLEILYFVLQVGQRICMASPPDVFFVLTAFADMYIYRHCLKKV